MTSWASGKNWRDDSVTLGVIGFLGSYPNTGTAGPVDLERDVVASFAIDR